MGTRGRIGRQRYRWSSFQVLGQLSVQRRACWLAASIELSFPCFFRVFSLAGPTRETKPTRPTVLHTANSNSTTNVTNRHGRALVTVYLPAPLEAPCPQYPREEVKSYARSQHILAAHTAGYLSHPATFFPRGTSCRLLRIDRSISALCT